MIYNRDKILAQIEKARLRRIAVINKRTIDKVFPIMIEYLFEHKPLFTYIRGQNANS